MSGSEIIAALILITKFILLPIGIPALAVIEFFVYSADLKKLGVAIVDLRTSQEASRRTRRAAFLRLLPYILVLMGILMAIAFNVILGIIVIVFAGSHVFNSIKMELLRKHVGLYEKTVVTYLKMIPIAEIQSFSIMGQRLSLLDAHGLRDEIPITDDKQVLRYFEEANVRMENPPAAST